MLTNDAELLSGTFAQVEEARGKKLIADGKAKGLENFDANDPSFYPDTHPQYKIMHPPVVKPATKKTAVTKSATTTAKKTVK